MERADGARDQGLLGTLLLYGLFAAVSVQKCVRDRTEGIPVSGLYVGLAWLSLGLAATLLTASLWNSPLEDAAKGFYAMAAGLALFAAVAIQKNVRDVQAAARDIP